jgi:hypothetical protein
MFRLLRLAVRVVKFTPIDPKAKLEAVFTGETLSVGVVPPTRLNTAVPVFDATTSGGVSSP